jgi:hypothetical protein
VKLEPADRFLMLNQLVDDADAPTPETLRAFAASAWIVLRHMQGRATQAEAVFAIERARVALLEARA